MRPIQRRATSASDVSGSHIFFAIRRHVLEDGRFASDEDESFRFVNITQMVGRVDGIEASNVHSLSPNQGTRPSNLSMNGTIKFGR